MSDHNKNDTINELYRAFRGRQYNDPGKSRLKQSTNTLIGVDFFDENDIKTDVTTGFKEIPNIPVDMTIFRDIITDHLKFYIIATPIQEFDEVRFTEVHNLTPTGRSRLVNISKVVVGDGTNGVMEGFYIIGWT